MRALLLCFLMACAFAQAPLNLNTATETELAALPGIGPSKAAAIVAWRNENGPFARVEDLLKVDGVGPATLVTLRDRVTVPEPAPAATGGRVDINTADHATLQQLPGVGPTKAQAIIDWRNANGPFSSCDELAKLPAMGPATVASLKGVCTAR